MINLFWSYHVEKIASKASNLLGLIKRTFKDLKDVSVLRTLMA